MVLSQRASNLRILLPRISNWRIGWLVADELEKMDKLAV